MEMIAIAIFIIFILILLWALVPAEKMKVGAPNGVYVKSTPNYPRDKSEKMVNEQDWATMSRGLSAPISEGYPTIIGKLSEMEKSSTRDITTDNRVYEDNTCSV